MSEAMLRVRLGAGDTHYSEGLIPAATLLRLFADASTEIGLRENDGREGLLAAYEGAEFIKPCRVGDYLEIRAKVLSRGNRSRRVEISAWRALQAPTHGESENRWRICEPPELVAKAVLVSVTPKA
jgi:3-aminobutyryl-CoA ammonia-lyase